MDSSSLVSLLPTAASVGIYLTILVAFALAMRRKRAGSALEVARAPRVTIFKPLAGTDDELEANLESFAAIDYPAFEILFGVASPDDPAYSVARKFIARHKALTARLVLTDRETATNPKVAQLISLDRLARGEIVVISDSNVRVSPSYLWHLVRELSVPGTGMVTSAFAGTGERSIGAALENLQLGALIGPGIVASTLLTNKPFTVGKSMAMWRRDLVRMGGFAPVGGVLAEDYVLGRAFMAAGHGVRTSLEVVENRNVDCSVRRTLERHSRWAKMRRALAPAAFAFEPLMSPLVVATMMGVAFPSKATVAALAAAAVLQSAGAFLSLRLLRGHGLKWYYAPLEIARTYVLFFCWMRACASRRIKWRGHAFLVLKGSVIVPAPRSSLSRLRAAVRNFA